MTNQSNPVDIDAIRARANAATKGPWETAHDDTHVGGPVIDGDWDWIIGDLQIDDGQDQEDYRGKRLKENCIFVAHARQDIPALCDEVESLRAEVKNLKASIPPPHLVWVTRKELADYESLRERVKELEEIGDHYQFKWATLKEWLNRDKDQGSGHKVSRALFLIAELEKQEPTKGDEV
jgi:hypothetical protein